MAYDGSTQSDLAIREAYSIARRFEGSIIILHIAWNKTEEEVEKLMKRAESKLKNGDVIYELKIVYSEYIPRTIVRFSMDNSIDLIVIGSRGLSSDKAWILGSVSTRVIEESPVPVFVVK